jgi:N4-gp56 family major capsid protein
MPSGYTAFGAGQPQFKRAWVSETVKAFRQKSFWEKFMGTDANNVVQRITELKKTDKGDRAMIGLKANMKASGVVGDNDIDSRRESLETYWIEVNTDQLRKSVASKGRVDDQQSVLDFRTEAKDSLSDWKAQINDDLMFLAASNISFAYNTDGSTRAVGAEDLLTQLEYAADVAVSPTSKRHFTYDGTNIIAGNTGAIAAAYVPKYGALVDICAEAKTRGVKPLMINGQEVYVHVVHPKTFARYKKDADFRDVLVNAGDRGLKNPLFTGAAAFTVDGILFHVSNKVYNTAGASSGSKWGAGSAVDGTRSLLLGQQAMLMADIWGAGDWHEETLDSGAKNAITLAQYSGILKPAFMSRLDGDTVQDFGCICLDYYL